MQSRAERLRVEQSQRVRLGGASGGRNPKASDAKCARTQDPHRAGVAADRRRHRDVASQRRGHPFRPDGVGHQRRESAVFGALGVERAEIDELTEQRIGRVANVNSVRHYV